jgi:GNAT superfamily N-acetyltransferase
MQIAGLTDAQHAEYLALVNAEIRPSGPGTTALDDFPLALGPDNLAWMLAATDGQGRLAGGIATLVRTFTTSCGDIAIGAIGSVVTRADCRGQGLSARLQAAALELLRRQEVPLAALWTDRPEIYAGRGFVPAGWEWHAGLEAAALPAAAPVGVALRDWAPGDLSATQHLYEGHRWRTHRREGDASRLYGMPGTRGLVAESGGVVRATVFCGKGADFPDYVTEWGGDHDLVLCLLGLARSRALATAILVPAGEEAFAGRLAGLGALPLALPAGCWAVPRPDILLGAAQKAGVVPPPAPDDARAWLGGVTADGDVEPGPLALAVWGFDSV